MTDPPRVPERPSLREIAALNHDSEVFHSDTGNAKRFVQTFRDRVRYEPDTQRWYVWAETHWEPDVEGLAFALTETVIHEMRLEALAMPDEPGEDGAPSARRRMLSWALKTEAEGARRRMLDRKSVV